MKCMKYTQLHTCHPFIGDLVSDFVCHHDIYTIPTGRYELTGGCYVNVDEYKTRENKVFEMHRKYIDVQLLVKGQEQIFCTSSQRGCEDAPYDEEHDISFLKNDLKEYNIVCLSEEDAIVLWPWEPHAPCNFPIVRPNRKLVFKIPVELISDK